MRKIISKRKHKSKDSKSKLGLEIVHSCIISPNDKTEDALFYKYLVIHSGLLPKPSLTSLLLFYSVFSSKHSSLHNSIYKSIKDFLSNLTRLFK